MKKHFLLLIIIAITSSIYLNWSYSRIYNRNETIPGNIPWPQQISFPNPNFQNYVKYVSLGDSLTTGVGSNNITNTLPYLFSQKLSQKMSVILVNLAVRGATTDNLIKSQLAPTIEKKPNYITILIGVNDIHNFTSTVKFQRNFEQIINDLSTKTPAKIIVFNIPYLGSSGLILPPYNIIFDYYTRRYNKIIATVCSKKNIMMIDLYTTTKEKFVKQTGFYSDDQFHPSGEGYQFWGQLIDGESL